MPEAASPLAAWESFYVIVGSSGAALTGLMFVVITLTAESHVQRSDQTIAAFATPTVVHFCAALLISAILSAPWRGLGSAGAMLAACGLAGVAYVAIVVRRARGQTGYRPVLEDWIWHAVLPLAAYAALTTGGLTLRGSPEGSLFAVGAAAVLLIFIGIHNAWDTVTYIAIARPGQHESVAAPEPQPQPAPPAA